MPFEQINIYGVIVCAILYMLIGFLWYSLLFKDEWVRLTNFSMDKHKGHPLTYLGAFIVALILSFVMDYFIAITNSVTFTDGLIIGALAWLGFVATTHFSKVLWERYPFKLYLIHVLMLLIAFLLIGGILGAWR